MTDASSVVDLHGRPLGVLRLSLTARCNLACPYCCPDSRDPEGMLELQDQLRLIRVACSLGVHTVRLTGGEPLLSDRLEPLLSSIALDRPAGLKELALTTNGVLLSPERALRLRRAGLDRITISLDGADAASIARMAGLQGGAKAGQSLLNQVLSGLEAARSAGFDPSQGALKLNAVIQKGRNDDQLIPLARLARDRGVELRLIEYMDVGSRNGWSLNQVMPALEMVQRVASHWPLDPVGRSSSSTTSRWQYRDGAGHLGVIASISAPFCGDCNRIRVTADGQIFTCLFASQGADLRPYLRASEPEAQLRERLSGLWMRRSDRFSEERRLQSDVDKPHAEMAYLGG